MIATRCLRHLTITLSAALIASTAVDAHAATSSQKRDTFYVVTNKAKGNSVVGYRRAVDGHFKKLGEFSTGGKGTGDLEIPALKKDPTHPLANGDDPLISAHAIAATDDGKYIVAVNPGDATIGLLRVRSNGKLRLVGTVRATDNFPISVAIHGNHVVVASVGKSNAEGSIGAYTIKNGRLKAVAKSRRDLHARPSTVDFSSDGRFVIVNELVTGKIHAFAREGSNLSAKPVSTVDSPRSKGRFQAIPVGFEVANMGGHDVILMSEARFLTPDFKLRAGRGEVVQSPKYTWQTGSLSTYRLDRNGQLAPVTQDALTGSATEGGEIANCWVAVSADKRVLYTANALSSSISSFDIAADGGASLRALEAFKVESETLFFSDMAVSRDGKELYQLVGNRGQVIVFDIGSRHELTPKQIVSGLPELGAFGLVVL